MFKDRKTESAENQIFKVLSGDAEIQNLREAVVLEKGELKPFIVPRSNAWEKMTGKEHEDRESYHHGKAAEHHRIADEHRQNVRFHAKRNNIEGHKDSLEAELEHRIEAKKHDLHAELHGVHKHLKYGNKLADIVL